MKTSFAFLRKEIKMQNFCYRKFIEFKNLNTLK